MKQPIFISAQTDNLYYAWQVEVMINNFIDKGVNPENIHIVCHKQNIHPSDHFLKLQEGYNVKFFFYEDDRISKKYPSSIRPHILKKHFKENPELKNRAIFYHDCDIIFTKNISEWITQEMIEDDTWYGSDTRWYNGYNYVISKGQEVFKDMCDIVSIDPQDVIDNEYNTIGAQYLMKNIDDRFWAKVERDCEKLYDKVGGKRIEYAEKISGVDRNELVQIDDRFFKGVPKYNDKGEIISNPVYHSIQIWCADMWAVLWNAWLFGHKTKSPKSFDFSWANSSEQEYNRCNIMHNAGVVGASEGQFFKGGFNHSAPYNKNLQITPNTSSWYYYEEIKKVEKKSFLIDNIITGRNNSFLKVKEKIKGKDIVIVETGSIREDSDKARIGDGWSSYHWAEHCSKTNSELYIIDIDQRAIDTTKKVIERLFGILPNIHYIVSDSLSYLSSFNKQIDLLFLDSYDYVGDEDNIKRCHEHNLNELKAVEHLLKRDSIILIDDVFNESWDGKGKLTIPYVLNKNWEVSNFEDGQVLLEYTKNSSKVSCVCTTFKRFECVEYIVSQFLNQTYSDKELIIFNTDEENPIELSFNHPDIKIINNSKDYKTGQPYTNRGAICRDAVEHTTGDYFMLMDDDDIYLPWYIQQAYDNITKCGRDAWKPTKSFFATPHFFELTQNVMEASVIVKMNRIKEIGFKTDKTGEEGLSWYTKLRDEGHIIENEIDYIPSYCFNWSGSTGNSAHKQSGDINNSNNFENHKENSFDIPNRKIQIRNLYFLYYPYIDFIKKNYDLFNQESYKKYLNGLSS